MSIIKVKDWAIKNKEQFKLSSLTSELYAIRLKDGSTFYTKTFVSTPKGNGILYYFMLDYIHVKITFLKTGKIEVFEINEIE